MVEFYNVYKRLLIDGLRNLSSREFQQRAWFPNKHPEISSFIEDANAVFDDTGLIDAMKAGRVVFDQKTDQALWELSDAIDRVDEFRPDEEIIDDPLMEIVREKAFKALHLIQLSDSSESTVEIVE